MGTDGVVRFGDFQFDLRTRELRDCGGVLPLEQKPAEFLRALLEHPGELVTRAELRTRLWPPGVHLDFDHALNKSVSKLRDALGDSREHPRFIETLSQRGYRFIAPVEIEGRADKSAFARIRVAVLPYENRTGDSSLDDLVDGLTEETIARLGALLRGGIRIIALASVLRYKKSPSPVAHVSRELAVDWVLAGRLIAVGGRYELRLELVSGSDEAQLWAGRAAASAPEQLCFEEPLTREIGEALSARVRTLPAQCTPQKPIAAGREAYLRARRLWHQRTESAVHEAIAEYRRAIQVEPQFAMAYAGLAECYMMLNSWGALAPKPSQELAEEAAGRALELNPCLAEPHVVSAYTRLILGDNWHGADRAFHAAISRNPSCAIAHQLYGFLQVPRGRFDDGLRSNARALEVDPLSVPIQSVRAWLLICAGREEEALSAGHTALELGPGHVAAHFHYANICSALGRHKEAVAHQETAFRLARGMPLVRICLAASLAAAGERAAALAHLDEIQQNDGKRYLCGFMMAIAYAALGMTSQAIEWIARNFEEREPNVAFATVEPRLAALREEPAFASTLREIHKWLNVAQHDGATS